MNRSLHPFPARMAPEIALRQLKRLDPGSVVLDPMSGSGTVARAATEQGLGAVVLDLDPLAVLMTRVATMPVDDIALARVARNVVRRARSLEGDGCHLPWMDSDQECVDFVQYWFGKKQRRELRAIAWVLADEGGKRRTAPTRAALDCVRLALSRIIITKDRGASLARDVSHSRPHKVADESDFDVFLAFERSIERVRSMVNPRECLRGQVRIELGDAREMRQWVPNQSIDVVVTSPPYLNAIDYMRGHRLAWLGHTLQELRTIRSTSIGAEKALDPSQSHRLFDSMLAEIGRVQCLPSRHQGMIERYCADVYRLMSELARVLKPDGRATLVVGNSCLQGIFVSNAAAVRRAGHMVGLKVYHRRDRELPENRRYLPIARGAGSSLQKRMRTETVLRLRPA